MRLRSAALLAALLLAAAPLAGQDAKSDKKPETKPATLVVKAPSDAEIYIDDEKMTFSGNEKSYTTPPLAVGKKYYYMVKSFREPNNYTKITRVRKAFVKAGETTTIDLTGPSDPKQPDDIKIRYVPTPQSVGEKMLEIAKCGKNDVVFDIGCGDGRMVATGVKQFGAKRGVGVDIDPDRIKDCQETLKTMGFSDIKTEKDDKGLKTVTGSVKTGTVEFRRGDALKIPDLEDATVICLYLGDDLMELLKPIFLARLKPGTRVVSHRFKWKGWAPDKTITHKDKNIWGEDDEFELHFWTIPEKGKLKLKKEEDEKKAKEDD